MVEPLLPGSTLGCIHLGLVAIEESVIFESSPLPEPHTQTLFLNPRKWDDLQLVLEYPVNTLGNFCASVYSTAREATL